MKMCPPIVLAAVLGFSACGLLGSNDEPPPEPGRRDYTWTADTLVNPPDGWFYDIGGASPDDMWAVSGGGLYPLWHYDGAAWAPWPEYTGPAFYTVFAFARDDVWMGGNDGKIFHFDGSEWSRVFTYKREGMHIVNIMDIWGRSASDIYAAGTFYDDEGVVKSLLLHYDGEAWTTLIVTDDDVQFQVVRESRDGDVLLVGSKPLADPSEEETWPLYRYEDGALIDVKPEAPSGANVWLGAVAGELYVSLENEVFVYDGGRFEPHLTLEESTTIYSISGRHERDLFLSTSAGLAHSNGTDTEYLLEIPRDVPGRVYRAAVFEFEVFFMIHDVNFRRGLIYHGRLPHTETPSTIN